MSTPIEGKTPRGPGREPRGSAGAPRRQSSPWCGTQTGPPPLPIETKLTFTVKGFMAVSELGRSTVYQLIKSGRLKVVRVGGQGRRGRTLITAASARELLGA